MQTKDTTRETPKQTSNVLKSNYSTTGVTVGCTGIM